MLTILFSIAMASIARRERRRAWLWGMLTFTISIVIQTQLVPGYWGAVLGLLLSFALMTWANIKYPVDKGPMLL